MIRNKIDSLKRWKSSPERKPLILKGARQVGKTWLMKEFGKICYARTVYINFETDVIFKDIFKRDLDPMRIMGEIEIYSGSKIDAANTLIIFDEIQSAERGLMALKYFDENAPQYHIIAAGSLLGMSLRPNESFPVGKVNFMTLRPLSFFEYLEASGEELLLEKIMAKDWNLLANFHEKLLSELKYYMYVGGMPEVVASFIKDRDVFKARKIQREIITAYENDFAKHAPSTTVARLRMVWESLPNQLSKENKKFIYNAVRPSGRARDFEVAIQWLLDCGLLLKNCNLETPKLPLQVYKKLDTFKLYLLDVGLLGALSNLDAKTIIDGSELFTTAKGMLAEQYAMQQLTLNEDIDIAYWTNDKGSAEVDFVIQSDSKIIPLEVKSADNVRSQSLKIYCEKFKPELVLRASTKKYEKVKNLESIPLYAIELIS